LAQLQAPVHELPIDREELRRPVTPDVGDSTVPVTTPIIAAWTIAS
jgi:hypothetical protein